MWWLGLRDVEKERYTTDGANFEHDERDFRGGFEGRLAIAESQPVLRGTLPTTRQP